MEIDPTVIIHYLTGEATADERAQVDRWRAARLSNELKFLRRNLVWELASRLPQPDSATLETRPRPLLRRVESAPPVPARRRYHRIAQLAAALAVGISLGLLFERFEHQPLYTEDVVTDASEVTTLSLTDGTIVRLGPDSRIGFRDRAGPRDIYLQGQAYFAVPEGGVAPFRVHTGGGELTVLGTRFDVEARGPVVQVIVVQGEVEMGPRSGRVNLKPRQVGRLGGDGELTVETLDDVYGALTWMGSFIAYESTTLRDVADEFDRRFGLTIEIVDPSLEGRTVTGWFSDQSPRQMLGSICLAVDAACTNSNGIVRMTARNANVESPPGMAL